MRSKKITAAVLGIVLTLGLVVSGCGNSGTSSDGSAKAERITHIMRGLQVSWQNQTALIRSC